MKVILARIPVFLKDYLSIGSTCLLCGDHWNLWEKPPVFPLHSWSRSQGRRFFYVVPLVFLLLTTKDRPTLSIHPISTQYWISIQPISTQYWPSIRPVLIQSIRSSGCWCIRNQGPSLCLRLWLNLPQWKGWLTSYLTSVSTLACITLTVFSIIFKTLLCKSMLHLLCDFMV